MQLCYECTVDDINTDVTVTDSQYMWIQGWFEAHW